MTPEFNFNNIHTIFNQKKKLVFGVFNGASQLTIWDPGFQGKGPAMKFNLGRGAGCVLLNNLVKRILSNNGPSAETVTFTRFDPESKKRIADGSFVLRRGDDGLFVIELTKNNNTYSFQLRGSGNMTMGSEPMQPADRSKFDLMVLQNVLEVKLPHAEMLSASLTKPFNTKQTSGGGGGSSFGSEF